MLLLPISTVHAGETLNNREELYEAIAQDCLNFTTKATYTINFSANTIDFDAIINKMKEENQVLGGNVNMWKYQKVGNQFIIEFGYLLSKSEYEKCLEMINDVCEQFDDDMTTYQKVKASHDYLCEAFRYSYMHDGPYDGFFTGNTDCEGYAMGFQMMMDYFDIPCLYIADGTHAWNIVMVDNGWYNIDVTWDDADGANGQEIRYDYFLKSAFNFDGHTFASICEPVDYDSDFSYTFKVKNLTQWRKYAIISIASAIVIVLIIDRVRHIKQIKKSKEEPITFKEYNWSEQRAQREMQDHFAQQKQVDNTMINGEIISKKENNNESKS